MIEENPIERTREKLNARVTDREVMIRRQYKAYGRVQGVGFRFTVMRTANALRLTGWTRNEYDGSVTTELQGEEAAMDRLWEAVKNGSFIRIDAMDVTEKDVIQSERSFEIRR